MMFITVHSSEENTRTSNSKQFVDTNKDEKAIFFFFGFVLFETAFLYEKALKNFIFFSKYLVESSEKFQTSTLFLYSFK